MRRSTCRHGAGPVTVDAVTIDVDEDIAKAAELYTDKRPYRCGRGHWLLPGHMIVRVVECSCRRGRHTAWECECGESTYSPAVKESCTLQVKR
jgi:hypothetical protein